MKTNFQHPDLWVCSHSWQYTFFRCVTVVHLQHATSTLTSSRITFSFPHVTRMKLRKRKNISRGVDVIDLDWLSLFLLFSPRFAFSNHPYVYKSPLKQWHLGTKRLGFQRRSFRHNSGTSGSLYHDMAIMEAESSGSVSVSLQITSSAIWESVI